MTNSNASAYRRAWWLESILILLIVGLPGGCAVNTGQRASRPDRTRPLAVQDETSEPVSTVVDARPAALVNGKSVTWGNLRVGMTEAAGATALREYILDRLVSQAGADARIVVDDDMIAKEKLTLLESLSDDPDVALRLLNELRDRQGLGTQRFDNLLRRNAILRELVQPSVRITEQAIEQLHAIRYGPKRQARLIVTPDLDAAQRVLGRIRGGDRFGDVAVASSTDASAARGGLLEPVSRVDPSYPEAIRKALFNLESGAMSSPILLDNGYAILLMVREIPADDVALADVRSDLRRMARLNQERLLMDDLATRLIDDASVTIFDDALHESWQRDQRLRR
jgi:parvulin-like peptidyl-prolyl isomerase